MVGEQDARAASGAAHELHGGLDRLGTAVREEASVRIDRHPGDECLGEEPRERLTLHLYEVRQRAFDRIPQRLFDHGMAPAEREHPEPREEVEVTVAVPVEQVRAFGAHVVAVEADRAQHAGHLRVQIALVQRKGFVPALGEQRLHVEGSGIGHNPSFPARRMRSTAPPASTNPCSTYQRTARSSASRARACSSSPARCAPGCRRTPSGWSPYAPARTEASARAAAHWPRTTPHCARSGAPARASAARAAPLVRRCRRASQASCATTCSRRRAHSCGRAHRAGRRARGHARRRRHARHSGRCRRTPGSARSRTRRSCGRSASAPSHPHRPGTSGAPARRAGRARPRAALRARRDTSSACNGRRDGRSERASPRTPDARRRRRRSSRPCSCRRGAGTWRARTARMTFIVPADVDVVEEVGVCGPEAIHGGEVEHRRDLVDAFVERAPRCRMSPAMRSTARPARLSSLRPGSTSARTR